MTDFRSACITSFDVCKQYTLKWIHSRRDNFQPRLFTQFCIIYYFPNFVTQGIKDRCQDKICTKQKNFKWNCGMFSVRLIKYRQKNNTNLKITTVILSFHIICLIYSPKLRIVSLPFWFNFRIVDRWFIYLPKMIFSPSPSTFSIGPFALLYAGNLPPQKFNTFLLRLTQDYSSLAPHYAIYYGFSRKATNSFSFHCWFSLANGPKSGPFTPSPFLFFISTQLTTRTLLLL